MMNFLRAVWRLRFRSRYGIAQKANAYQPGHVKECHCDKFTGKPQQYFPQKGWRLLDRISCTTPPANIDYTHDMEFDEDILERIDFLACLFGTRKIE
jgi:hypothetical protein